jgi:hypothetical protein
VDAAWAVEAAAVAHVPVLAPDALAPARAEDVKELNVSRRWCNYQSFDFIESSEVNDVPEF